MEKLIEKAEIKTHAHTFFHNNRYNDLSYEMLLYLEKNKVSAITM